jgi:DNA-binding protein HU-beta
LFRRNAAQTTSSKGATVNKNELVDTVAEASHLKKGEAEIAVDAVFDVIASALKKGDEVRIVGFGTFSVSNRAASEGRNPRTGEKIAIAASKQPKFRAGKGLKDAIR